MVVPFEQVAHHLQRRCLRTARKSGPRFSRNYFSLNHTRLVSMDIDPRSLSANFTFDNELSLILFSIFREESEHWKMFCPGGKVFVAGPGAEYDWTDSG
jgi:hypothetical protein